MNNLKRYMSSLFLWFFLVVLAGCGNESSGLPSQLGESVNSPELVVTPDNPSISAGKTLQLTSFYREDNSSEDVTENAQYFSDNQAVAKVDKAGLVSAISEGTAIITVLYQGIQKDVTAEVTAPTLSKLEVIPGVTASAIGIEIKFIANAIYSDGSKEDITQNAVWESKNKPVATIKSPGLVETLAEGQAEISAMFDGESASAILTITEATIDSIVVSPKNFNLPNGLTQQLTATAQLSDGTTQDVSAQADWKTNAAAVATVDENGLVTSVADSGTATITATIDSQSDTATVTATEADVTQLTISPANPSLPEGTSKQFKAEAVFSSDNTAKDVTNDVVWSSSSVAVSINDSGLARAESEGSATITATLGDESTTTMVTVTDAVINSVTVTTEPNPVELAKGEKAKITVLANYSDGSQVDVTDQATLSIQDPSIAAIVDDSFIEAVAIGNTTVTARFNSLDSAPVDVTVTSETLASITVSSEPSPMVLPVGVTGQLQATGTYSDNSTKDITNQINWTTASSSVATVDDSGVVTAVAVGNTDIKASLNGVDASGVPVEVTNATIISEGLTVDPSSLDLAKGDIGNLVATAEFTDGSIVPATNSTIWTTSDSTVATVTSGGEVQAIEQGTVTITGTYQGESATAAVNVGPKRADLLHLNAVRTADLDLLGLIQLEVGEGDSIFTIRSTVTYSDGSTEILEPNEPQYMTDNTQLISIDATGEVTLADANVLESANVTASFESLVSDNQINVACLARADILGIITLGLACDIDDTQPNPNYVAP
ncbi:Ig-like domain-containing protein [Vibrio algivorus]|uniref:BIG2 domain-containing protein n=1 Tax=Vibrio algivorus TaxID=1667024 RepID=A0A557PAW9_9VIBR|nr:Ig-like domain-containing protein [Vibrio algivorus]TVO37804.1 hypothetical protein FOF44_05900 [Vibrio algivorus]